MSRTDSRLAWLDDVEHKAGLEYAAAEFATFNSDHVRRLIGIARLLHVHLRVLPPAQLGQAAYAASVIQLRKALYDEESK